MSTIDVGGGLKLNYVEEGTGDPIVFAAGGVGNIGRHLHLFAPHFRASTYDSRGSGESDWADWYSVRASCDDLTGLLKALNIDKAIIFGSSSEGVLALHFALQYPELTRALVIDASSAEVGLAAAQNWRGMAREAVEPGNDRQKSDLDPQAQFATFHSMSELYDNPLTPRLKEIACPTLVLVGEQDKIMGVGGSVKISRAIPDSVLKIVPESGYTVLTTTPEVALKEILAFTEGLK